MNIFTIQEKNIVSYRNGKLKEGENDKEIRDISVILSSNIIYKTSSIENRLFIALLIIEIYSLFYMAIHRSKFRSLDIYFHRI